MAERAAVTAQLASANARYCVGNCATLAARRATLSARLDSLNAEADEARRAQVERDQVAARRDALLADPVTSRLAALLRTTTARVDLLSGLMFAAILEGVACLLWAIALQSPSSRPLPLATGLMPPTVAPVTEVPDATAACIAEVAGLTTVTPFAVSPAVASPADETVSRKVVPEHDGDASGRHAPRDAPVTSLLDTDPVDDHLTQLARDVAAGLIRPTV
ncbi:hypothetical protein WS66_13100 [Burkholderia sp. LA-2-3-30-S1-D2]|nr:hypothetical protein WS66_13100 [Burkholderia sp. LA-2-3-30-S1-D2]KVE10341.1 hypothetical protein WS66_23280 [Burkholderia sp. LA-2-3-30-S1-D2]